MIYSIVTKYPTLVMEIFYLYINHSNLWFLNVTHTCIKFYTKIYIHYLKVDITHLTLLDFSFNVNDVLQIIHLNTPTKCNINRSDASTLFEINELVVISLIQIAFKITRNNGIDYRYSSKSLQLTLKIHASKLIWVIM